MNRVQCHLSPVHIFTPPVHCGILISYSDILLNLRMVFYCLGLSKFFSLCMEWAKRYLRSFVKCTCNSWTPLGYSANSYNNNISASHHYGNRKIAQMWINIRNSAIHLCIYICMFFLCKNILRSWQIQIRCAKYIIINNYTGSFVFFWHYGPWWTLASSI